MTVRPKYFVRNIWILVIILTLSLIGCRRIIGAPNRHIGRDINESELVGVWRITEDSLRQLVDVGYSLHITSEKHELVLREDGSCNVRTYAYTIDDPSLEDQKKHYIDSVTWTTCTWELVRLQSYVRHNIVEVPGIEIIVTTSSKSEQYNLETSSTALKFYIAEEHGNILLWYYIGDPDYYRYLDFIRVPVNNSREN